MPQNNQDITQSPEFKEFVKKANLEVLNLEAIAVVLFSNSIISQDQEERIQKLEERLMEVAEELGNDILHHNRLIGAGKTLADKWK